VLAKMKVYFVQRDILQLTGHSIINSLKENFMISIDQLDSS